MPSQRSDAPRRDIHAEITNALIDAVLADPGSPRMPWRRTAGPLYMPSNALTRNAYRGINVVSLWVSAEVRGYATPIWATYRQWSELGAQVRQGERSTLVVFYKEYESEPDPSNADDDGKRRVARASYVFNADQVDGFTLPVAPRLLGPIERLEGVDRFVTATRARVEHGGDRAFYRQTTDTIHMPDEGLFYGTDTMDRNEAYYAVLAHELTHWTGAKQRLSRDMSHRFGENGYAAEELVAEIASAFLCSELGITQDTRIDHAQYVANWLQLMQDDSRAIFAAAAKASEAVAYLKKMQPPG
ncbi:MAG: ssDNA-binding domain-containing protein [Hyphomicrobium sp.]|uniref:ArdC family protein n=1 Tax=Hyphomicrobium sp. TaxID=82 RepID=UPI0025BFD5BC|nr:zincin-like metallopeptidase domain-containing protein [Hyphomicrobium sp.]MBX9865086.1 ssDNA-binding domain-containing protein [Hyphomicrobium sp.]